MPHPRLASSAIVERGGRYLLVRRAHPPAADLFAFPGGRAESGESAAETALRELHEETGITGRDPVLFAHFDIQPERGVADSHFHLSVFVVQEDGHGTVRAASDARDAAWYLPEEIMHLPVPESVRDCILRLAPHCLETD